MVDDLQEHREDSTEHQDDATEWKNRGLTTRLDKSHNSFKQKAPALADNLRQYRGFFMLQCVVFWQAKSSRLLSLRWIDEVVRRMNGPEKGTTLWGH